MADAANAMVMTVLEAEVPEGGRATLEAEFRAKTARGLPPGLAQSFLVRAEGDSGRWRIVSVWESAEALARMRAASATPTGVLIFRAAGAEPALTVFDVVVNPRR